MTRRHESASKRMQAARASAIWYGQSMLTDIDKVPLFGRGDARDPDAGGWAAGNMGAWLQADSD